MMQFENINEAQVSLLDMLLKEGESVGTRGLKTLELSPVAFSVLNPRDRITTIKGRKWNFGAAVGELIWHLSGSNDVAFIAHYLKQWSNYSDDGRHVRSSCYGHKIFKDTHGNSQWSRLIELLKADPGSRRAVLNLYSNKEGISLEPVDVSCTCTLQFLVRSGKINLIVYMRSNDIIWGLPYDFFFFSFLQELLAATLQLELGLYTHIAGSLHLYDHHFGLAEKMLKTREYVSRPMPPLKRPEDMEIFVSVEKKIRKGVMLFKDIAQVGLNSYWADLLKVLFYYNGKQKEGRQEELNEAKMQTEYAGLL